MMLAQDRPDIDGRQSRARPAGTGGDQKAQAAYLMAVGGAAYLVAKAIKKARVLAFEDLGMEAIHEFEVKDMPVTVAVDPTAHRCTTPARPSGRRKSSN